MRKLTSLELEWIYARLKSLHIRYTEVYGEIFDHYCTELETNPAIDSPAIIAKLNETFAWSVVKRMDQELEKNVSKQLLKKQLTFLRFWNHGIKGFLYNFGTLVITSLSLLLIPPTELFLVPLAIFLSIAIIVNYIKGYGLSFTLTKKPVSIWSASVFKKVCLFGNIIIWVFVMPHFFSGEAILNNPFYRSVIAIITILSILYTLSLLAIASTVSNHRTA